ncbi:hypothetical protein BDZ91DRAFT_714145 [Kalaharituber pfeilii]|nr:hypothetical protein BDZ91DRAFT_714145 [Kalaharituber pfeilii]
MFRVSIRMSVHSVCSDVFVDFALLDFSLFLISVIRLFLCESIYFPSIFLCHNWLCILLDLPLFLNQDFLPTQAMKMVKKITPNIQLDLQNRYFV